MATSIFHRATGAALVFGGLSLFTWWLAAAATSGEAYDLFQAIASGPIGWFVWIGLSWAFFQHLLSGLRHLLMDTGWGYDLGLSKTTAGWTFVGSALLTAGFWAIILLGPGAR